ncbi:DUF3284 domain-containing protein [Pseudolactococcus paracarnosus]|uniref:DUF3284 domain-containing protein n=1 Tax=Pseudolactococcus paracarnosus TaxID=2749962 RepID=A0A7L4WE39_9LACT|nr:DUF3284 domain-containing protein [Lactococcus paracarnosus]SPC35071.1 conserved hypothetical protein [Lactococcus piscium]MCJ1978142.1 DUF3284 domain-containing protein [Lactococcus paracarnosus]MCJ1984283.1 DUF3284 domain-containing protein [Lactococcus paracarnosus]MCJ1994912.1 DUF3284 domain-containing protein [Lactococcus paracarnosus]MCJ1998575.1 DUF3284 domain-containing protein [Lactococcus paracarnosus]
MKMVKTLAVPRQFIFEKILESGLYDIEKYTGKRPKTASLSGFKYKKKFSAKQNQAGEIIFDEVIEPGVYAFTTKTVRNTYTTRWEMHRIDDMHTEVVISEDMISHGFFQNLNDMIMQIGLTWIKKRQMTAILNAILRDYNGR